MIILYECGMCHKTVTRPKWIRYPQDFTAVPYCEECHQKAKEGKNGKDK